MPNVPAYFTGMLELLLTKCIIVVLLGIKYAINAGKRYDAMKLALKKFMFLFAALLVLAAPLSAINRAVAAAGPNLFANASAEIVNNNQPTGWNQGGWGNNTRTFTYADGGHSGGKSLGLTVGGYADGDAKWYAAPVAVSANTSYTYTDYYTSTISTDLAAQLTDANGNSTYQTLKSVAAANAWQQSNATFTTPANIKEVTIFHLIAGNGSLNVDDAYLGTSDTTPITPPVTPPADGNLIANSSLETVNGSLPQGWSTDKWGTNTATFSYDTTGHTGGRSASINMTAYSNGDAKWYASPVGVSANTQYTYTDYYKSSVVTEIVAQFQDSAGNYTYKSIASPSAANNWTQATGTFTTPASVKNVAIFHIINKVGTLQLDDVSLKAGASTPVTPPVTPPAGANLVPNSSLETTNGTTPANWQSAGWGTNDRKFTYLGTGHTGGRSVQVGMTNRTDGDAEWVFPAQPVTAGKQYTFSDYYKSNVATEIDAKVTMADGTTQTMYIGTAVASPDWLHFERTFNAPANAVSITVIHLLYQVGTLTTDDYSLSEYAVVGFNRALVSLTFDDAWRSVYTNALPIMQKYGLKSTQYLLSGNTGDPDYMTKAQMKAFATAGHEIASHTVTHPDLVTLTASKLTTELSQSKTNLQTWTGATVKNFASPYGSYNSTVLDAVKKYYSSHRGVEVGFNSKNDFDIYDIKVQNIVDTTTATDVAAWIAQAQKDKTWLVLVYHQVSNAPAAGEYNTPIATFDAHMQAAKNSGVTVKTVQQSLTEILPQLGK